MFYSPSFTWPHRGSHLDEPHLQSAFYDWLGRDPHRFSLPHLIIIFASQNLLFPSSLEVPNPTTTIINSQPRWVEDVSIMTLRQHQTTFTDSYLQRRSTRSVSPRRATGSWTNSAATMPRDRPLVLTSCATACRSSSSSATVSSTP